MSHRTTPGSPFSVSVVPDVPDLVVIALEGEIDIACSDALCEGFARARSLSPSRLVVDASGVTFLDCGGVCALMTAAESAGSDVWLRSPSEPVRRLARLLGQFGPLPVPECSTVELVRIL